jgi:predicted lipid-binding transport protein (Tim44 family)
MESDELNWLASIISAGFLGVFITWGVLGHSATNGRRTAANWGGLVAGIVVGLGLGLLRLAHSEGWGEILFALALTVVDIGIVLMLEVTASSSRVAQHDYEEEKADSTTAVARLDMARAKLARCQARIVMLAGSLDKHIEYVELRAIRRYNIEDIKAAAIKAAVNGYHTGVAENIGRVRGAGGR